MYLTKKLVLLPSTTSKHNLIHDN